MSAIALSWVATVKVGNQTAKQLLQFYASHNFNKPGFEFKNETLADQLEVKVRAIQNAHKLLIEKDLLIKEERFGKDGSQLTSVFYLNIPPQFVDNFFNRGGEGVLKTSPPCLKDTPRGVLKTPLNNNINNKQNKREQPRKKREALPDDFEPNAEAKALAEGKGLDVFRIVAKFGNYYKSIGGKRQDWNAAFMKWIIDENEIKPIIATNVKIINKSVNENRSTVGWFNENH